MQRRKFLKSSGIFAAGFYASRLTAIAGPFLPGELAGEIPIDKKLDPQWVKSLYKRGVVTQYLKSKNELQYIGMPVGGITTGTLYLGGDGRLWLWDIFNQNQEGIDPKEVLWDATGKKVKPRDGSAYIAPPKAEVKRPLEQGFAFSITAANKTVIKTMDSADWDEIIFEATYPMATIRYIDATLPVEIIADVYSPFIALDDKNSALPATIYSFRIKNKSDQPISVAVVGWLENKVLLSNIKPTELRINRSLALGTLAAGVECSLKEITAVHNAQPDYGTLAIAALQKNSSVHTDFSILVSDESFNAKNTSDTEKPASELLLGSVSSFISIKPKGEAKADFVIAWHFTNLKLKPAIQGEGRYYSNWFSTAGDVVKYVQENFSMLSSSSRLWKETWYDSTLPWWFLERTFLNISTLATTTAHRFSSGRFYGWEGVGCCPGTCTHVWQYAQAMGRIFPSIEKDTRQRVDLGLSLQPDGMIWYRGEMAKSPAIDGQAGTVLRIYREHQMSADDSFLKTNWEKIKLATQYIINQDRNKDGMEDTPLENTLDAVWDGEISWLVGLCIAAVKAGEQMAIEMNDTAFAQTCTTYVQEGKKNMEALLFNGEYFIHRPDAVKGRKKLGSYNTCHIDQVYGQSWAFQVGLNRVLDPQKTRLALRALWKYNFTPDVGPYIATHKGGRPYALAGEGGMVMNTNPKKEARPYGEDITWQLGYFHECMSGFEHQVAAHMMAEGMTDEALVLTRMIHDRYHAAKRNPFNEIECSDHYARAMASYGTFITACGFEYHGPKGYMRFAPKMSADHFKAPFTSAEGWGTYEQQKANNGLKASLWVKYGQLKLQTFGVEVKQKVSTATVLLDGKKVPIQLVQKGNDCTLRFSSPIVIGSNQKLQINLA